MWHFLQSHGSNAVTPTQGTVHSVTKMSELRIVDRYHKHKIIDTNLQRSGFLPSFQHTNVLCKTMLDLVSSVAVIICTKSQKYGSNLLQQC